MQNKHAVVIEEDGGSARKSITVFTAVSGHTVLHKKCAVVYKRPVQQR